MKKSKEELVIERVVLEYMLSKGEVDPSIKGVCLLMVYAAFVLAFVFCIGMLYFIMYTLRAGVYPSKYILQRRALACGIGCVLFFILGFVFR